jgi:hypothetical protein
VEETLSTHTFIKLRERNARMARVCDACGALFPPGGERCPGCGAERPLGTVRSPWITPFLCLVTLGIYGIVWKLRVAREVERFAGRRDIRGVLIVGFVATVAAFVFVGADAIAGGGRTRIGLSAPGVLGVSALVLLGLGTCASLLGNWRIWRITSDDERARGVRIPLRPSYLVSLSILGEVAGLWVGFVGVAVALVVVGLTQSRLNGMWEASSGSAPALPAQTAAPPGS